MACANLPDVTGVLHIRFLTFLLQLRLCLIVGLTVKRNLLNELGTIVRNKPIRPSVGGHTENRGNWVH